MANPALVKMLGFSSFEDLAHRNLQEEGYEPDYPRAKFLETLEKEDKIIGLESAWHQRNGNTLYVRESASIIRDAAGKILYYDGNVEDITYRKQAEEALRESERRLREAQEMAHLGFWLWDIKTGDVEWSDEVFKIFCLDPATFKPRINSILDMSPWPEDHERDKELIRRAIESHDPGTYEQRFLRPDKSVGFYYSTFRGNYDNNGNLFSIVGTILDITERKKAEEILQESEARFRRLIESAPLPLCYVDKDGMITLRNERFIKIFGYNETDVPDLRQWWQKAYRDPEYRKWVVENWNEAVIQASKNGTDIQSKEYEVTCKDGSVRTIIISGITIGEDLLATFIDITERKKAEDAIRESEDKFKYIFEHSALGNSITHPNGETHFNNAFCEMLGYSEEELVKMKWQDFTHPDDFEITQKVFDILVSRESDSPRFIKRYLRKDGSVMWADVSTSLRYDKDNKPLYFMTTVNDITDLKLAEEVLRNDEKRFRELIEALPQLYWTCRVDGPCDYLSRQWVKYTGIPESDQLGYGWLEQLHPEDREKTITAWAEKVKNGTSFDIEFRIRRYDGEYHWFKTRAVPIHDSEGRLIRWLGSNTDIDSIRKAEDQLRNYSKDLEQRVILRTEQLEAANKELEAFSYSVSHDLRAPLRSVHGFTKILLEDYEANLDEEGKRICGIISSSATQMGELIDDLLSFSRIGRSSLNPSEIDMKKMAKVVFEGMTSPSERKRIKLKIGKLSSAFGDITLFGQVWTNLISNAIKYSSKIDVSEINIGSESDGKMITYFVKDNGVGFDMNYKHKLFSVFQRLHSEAEFEGNGVGLAIVQRIILKHGGKVWAEGEVGKGATFYFSLPEGDGQQATGDRKTKGSMPDARHPMPDANT
jgi:PAS domain S-box-containing protein